MAADQIPMRWPPEWKEPSLLELLSGTPVNCLLVEARATRDSLERRAAERGIRILDLADPPAGVSVIRGEWPGVRLSSTGKTDRTAAGPTGDPWIDSNGWRVRLASALRPGDEVWIDARPRISGTSLEAHRIAIADAAATGGRWIISLDARFAADAAHGKQEAVAGWQRLSRTVAFFEARREWSRLLPEAVIGVVSDFAGPNEFLSHELLNLLARANQQFRAVPLHGISRASFQGLRVVLYIDDAPPRPDTRDQLASFVAGGGILITGPQWGPPPAALAAGNDHPRFAVHSLGRGRVAVARAGIDDPYLLAADTVILMSHRYEPIRLWNAGLILASLSARQDRRRAVVQMVSYAPAQFGRPTLRVSGKFRTARRWTLDEPRPAVLELLQGKESTEVHLPPVSLYTAVDLEV